MNCGSLQDLPDGIISKIISYLPQQDKINLLYCNYKFYQLVQPLLYKNLLFAKASVLSCPICFDESSYTVIGVLKTPLASDILNNKIYQTRQEILLNSLTINNSLTKYIENIIIEGLNLNDETIEIFEQTIISELFDFLKSNCSNLKRFSTYHTDIQNIVLPSLTHIQLSTFSNFSDIIELPIKHLELNIIDNAYNLDQFEDEKLINFFLNLETIILNNEISQYILLNKLNKILNGKSSLIKLKNLKLIFYHYFENPYSLICSFLEKIDFNFLDSLELVLGCHDITCICLHKFNNYLIKKNINLKKLSLIQKTLHRDHNYTEAFDFLTTEILRKYPNHENLKYLSIRHMPPNDFNVDFGFEGNYLHRKELFENILPLLKGLETFISPTLLQSVACYEQMISNLLWNGCQCQHCDDYLPIFDKYIISHQYYDEMKSHMTDMISPILFGNVAKVLSKRLIGECDLFADSFPPLNKYWDFHTAPYEILHFDNCSFDKSAFPPVTTCVVHFLQSYVDTIGGMLPLLKKCVFSGVFFHRQNNSWICSESTLKK
jgi:hypothetical protein